MARARACASAIVVAPVAPVAAIAVVGLLALLLSDACVSYALPPEDDAGARAGSDADAGAPAVVITTLAPATASSPSGKLSAPWAAWQVDDGPWALLAPSAAGTYALRESGAATWAVAFACDDPTFGASTIAVFRRPASAKSLEAILPEPCALPTSPAFQLSGTLSNVPATTTWLEFGYALESRGAVFSVVSGTAGRYELVNVTAGTWDVAFGVRDSSFGPLTRVAIVRGARLTEDLALDVDLGAGAAGAFSPGGKALVVHGVAANDSLSAGVAYATGGPAGLAVGPSDVPQATSDVRLAFATVPAALQAPGDRYRFDVSAGVSRDGRIRRGVVAEIHDAVDVELTLPDPLPLPSAAFASQMPYVRVATTFGPRAGSASYVVDVVAEVTRKSLRRFVTSIDASIAAATETTPDLSGVAGFRPEWGPPSTQTTVTVTAVEPPAPLGDGSSRRSSSATVTLVPPSP